jgi:hypothetical protein
MWTEDYQVVTLTEHFKAFDTLYREGFLIGEMIWNFADFATPQGEVKNLYMTSLKLGCLHPVVCIRSGSGVSV